jgi:stage II sporulation protein D
MTSKRIISVFTVIFLAVIAVFLFFRYSKAPPPAEDVFTVRVRIAAGAKEARISSKSPCNVLDADTGKILSPGMVLPPDSRIVLSGNKIAMGARTFSSKRLSLSPESGNGIKVNGVLYRGEIDLLRRDGGFDIINTLDIEHYLMGVVPREMYSFWPIEALRAQAIVSRSYAAYEALRRKSRDHDLTSDVSSQVYGGRSAETRRTTGAVQDTRGLVLEYQRKIVPGYFHSCCGGHTNDVVSVWGGPYVEPLKGVRSRWCRWTPHFRWNARVPTEEIKEKLDSSGYHFTRIDDIRPGKRASSGRLESVRVRSGNRWTDISVKRFLSAMGRKTIRSTNFKIKKYPLFYLFKGYGWGHGVGMCQWCAFRLSLMWRGHKRILEHFYPGSHIVDMREIL